MVSEKRLLKQRLVELESQVLSTVHTVKCGVQWEHDAEGLVAYMMFIYIPICIHVYTVYMCVYIYTCIYINMFIYIHTHIYIYIDIYTCIYIHTYKDRYTHV